MNIFESIRVCFRKWNDFSGRARRSEYWWFQLFVILVDIVIGVVTSAFNISSLEVLGRLNVTLLELIFTLLVLIPNAAVTARRLHDINKSGWFQLPGFLFYLTYLETIIVEPRLILIGAVLVGLSGLYSLWLLIICIRDSQTRENIYGPNPKEPSMSEIFD